MMPLLEREGMGVACVCGVSLLPMQYPLSSGPDRKPYIARRLGCDHGQIQAPRQRQALFIQGLSTNNKNFRTGQGQNFLQTGSQLATAWRMAQARAHNPIIPTWQCFANRFIGFAAHDHGLAPRQLAKPKQILGQVPRQTVIAANHAIFRHSGD